VKKRANRACRARSTYLSSAPRILNFTNRKHSREMRTFYDMYFQTMYPRRWEVVRQKDFFLPSKIISELTATLSIFLELSLSQWDEVLENLNSISTYSVRNTSYNSCVIDRLWISRASVILFLVSNPCCKGDLDRISSSFFIPLAASTNPIMRLFSVSACLRFRREVKPSPANPRRPTTFRNARWIFRYNLLLWVQKSEECVHLYHKLFHYTLLCIILFCL